MTLGLIIGACLFIVCALSADKSVLWVPAILLLAAAAANAIAEPAVLLISFQVPHA